LDGQGQGVMPTSYGQSYSGQTRGMGLEYDGIIPSQGFASYAPSTGLGGMGGSLSVLAGMPMGGSMNVAVGGGQYAVRQPEVVAPRVLDSRDMMQVMPPQGAYVTGGSGMFSVGTVTPMAGAPINMGIQGIASIGAFPVQQQLPMQQQTNMVRRTPQMFDEVDVIRRAPQPQQVVERFPGGSLSFPVAGMQGNSCQRWHGSTSSAKKRFAHDDDARACSDVHPRLRQHGRGRGLRPRHQPAGDGLCGPPSDSAKSRGSRG